MKYICLGYLEPGKFENMSESERNTMLDECFSYNDKLRKNGHLVAEQPLQPANTALTVSWKNGKVAVTDGPYAETKEQLGEIHVLEARGLNHAIQLISQSPGVKLKCETIEIRPAADIRKMMRESEPRRRRIPRDEGGPEGKHGKNETESVSEFGHRLPKRPFPIAPSVVSDLQSGSFYWHACASENRGEENYVFFPRS